MSPSDLQDKIMDMLKANPDMAEAVCIVIDFLYRSSPSIYQCCQMRPNPGCWQQNVFFLCHLFLVFKHIHVSSIITINNTECT